MNKIVFLPHPGGEHFVDNPGYNFNYKKLISLNSGEMPWNTAPKHRRKFISSIGDYIDEKEVKYENKRICFWGEWEQESLFKKTYSNNKNNPQYIHTPLCKKSVISDWIKNGKRFDSQFENLCCSFFAGKQNTDPYVFGNHFLYSCCRQKGQLLNLKEGDLIVFFSGKGIKGKRKYVIDTIFVVGGRILPQKSNYFSNLNILKSVLSPEYLHGVILPICFGNNNSLTNNKNFVLYYGATFDKRINDMYSFIPCKAEKESQGFSRYVLFDEEKNEGIFKKAFSVQNFNIFEEEKNNVYNYWSKIKNDMLKQGYLLGIRVNEPSF